MNPVKLSRLNQKFSNLIASGHNLVDCVAETFSAFVSLYAEDERAPTATNAINELGQSWNDEFVKPWSEPTEEDIPARDTEPPSAPEPTVEAVDPEPWRPYDQDPIEIAEPDATTLALADNHTALALIAASCKSSTFGEVVKSTGLSDEVVRKQIKQLLADGRILKTGEKRGTRYSAIPLAAE